MAGKVQEAEECLLRAEKCLKTSFLKRKPDYEEAANEYEKASTIYKNARNNKKAIELNLKAAECYEASKQFFAAAKAYEQVGLVYGKDLNDYDTAIQFFEKASFMYREHGVLDTAGLCLDRGAKMLEVKNPEKAAQFYSQACDVSVSENKSQKAADYAGKAARVYIKLKRYEDAFTMTDKQLMHLIEAEDDRSSGRVVIYKVLIQLTREDFVAAKKAYLDGQAYCEQQESMILNALILAFDTMDKQQIHTLLTHSYLKTMDNEFAKLARDLALKHKPPKEEEKARKPQAEPQEMQEEDISAMM